MQTCNWLCFTLKHFAAPAVILTHNDEDNLTAVIPSHAHFADMFYWVTLYHSFITLTLITLYYYLYSISFYNYKKFIFLY